MAGTRPFLGLVSIFLLAGGVVLQFFVILSGAVKGIPINLVYFLQASTGGVTGGKPNIPNPARWTFFAVCGAAGKHNVDCGKVRAALPFSPPQNFGTHVGIPQQFIGTHQYYYLSRFMFAFFLIALFFAVCALLLSLLALCTRLGAYLSGFLTFLALFFQALAAALMTAWSVLGRNAFKKNGQSAKLGIYGYAFTWAALGCFLISSILFCIGGRAGKTESRNKSSGYFGRKRSTRSGRSGRSGKSRGSFVDSESGGRRIKDEYD